MPNKFKFTRQEALAVTSVTSNKLQYLERKGLVIPHRIGQTFKGSVVLYSLEQLMAIALDKQLKNIDNNCADSLVMFLANFDKPNGFDYSGKSLYCLGGYVSFDVKDLVPDIEVPIQSIVVVVPDLGDILAEIIGNAKTFVGFESFYERIIN